MIGNRPKYNLCKGLTSAFEINGKIYQFVNGCLISADDPAPVVKNFGLISYTELDEQFITNLYTSVNAVVNFEISDFEAIEVNYHETSAFLVTAIISGYCSDETLDFYNNLSCYEILGIGNLTNCKVLNVGNIGLEKFNPETLLPTSIETLIVADNNNRPFNDGLFIPDEFCDNIHIAPSNISSIVIGNMNNVFSIYGNQTVINKNWEIVTYR